MTDPTHWQPRAFHYMCQHEQWNGADFIVWIGRQIDTWRHEQGHVSGTLLGAHHEQFDQWLAEHCTCAGEA